MTSRRAPLVALTAAAVALAVLPVARVALGAPLETAAPAHGHSAAPGDRASYGGGTAATVTGHGTHSVARDRRTPLEPGETRTTVGIGGRYVPVSRNGASDDYRCFLVDPAFTEDRFLTGVRFVPGNPAVVHHAILFRVDPSQVRTARAKDRSVKGRGWGCFGGPGIGGSGGGLDSVPWMAAWAPGGTEQRFGDGVGVYLPKGGMAVLQVHYNLRAGGGADRTRVELRSRSGSAPLEALETMLLPAPVELPCTARESGPLCDRNASIADTIRRFGEDEGRVIAGLQLLCGGDVVSPRAGRTQRCDRRVNDAVTIRAAAGHMHLLGRSLRITLNPGTPGEATLLDVPVWDFDQQGARPLETPVRVTPGDVIRVTCTHDPRLRSQLPALQGTPPRYVTWGEGTTDEMCLGILSFTRS